MVGRLILELSMTFVSGKHLEMVMFLSSGAADGREEEAGRGASPARPHDWLFFNSTISITLPVLTLAVLE